jgi:2-C-methyl-D-erythritol 4-phosphate cytidylyltransferase
VIERVIRAARRYGAAMAAVRVNDTIKREGHRGFATETLPREELWAAQTPQGFRRSLLEGAHRRAVREGVVGTDEASLLERMGKRVRLVEGSPKNLKITTREDFVVVAGLAKGRNEG